MLRHRQYHGGSRHLRVVLEVDDLVEGLVVEVIVVAVAGDGAEAERLEDHAEEPGEEDVARHQPRKLPPVLLAVADPHPDPDHAEEEED